MTIIMAVEIMRGAESATQVFPAENETKQHSTEERRKKMGVASLVLGIVSIVIGVIFPYVGWLGALLGILGIIFGSLGIKKAKLDPNQNGLGVA